MLRFIRSATIASLALPATLFGQGFEGAITARMSGPQGAPGEVTYLVKGDRFRMDMASRGMSIYMLHEGNGSTYMVMPAQRMYMETGQVTAEQQAQKKAPDIKMTGKKETVAGYECEHMLITSDNETWDVCATKGLGSFTAMTNPMGRGAPAAATAWQRLGRDMFPLKVIRPGGSDITFEVTKVEKKSIDASLFALPDGFTKMDMGRMGRPPA
jgi:hypothetical protein